MNVPTVTGENLKAIIREQVSTDARIMTDEHGAYQGLNQEFAGHEAVALARVSTSEATLILTHWKGRFLYLSARLLERTTTLALNTLTATGLNFSGNITGASLQKAKS